jgi:quercetin dioxygenase-like cupin family protein
VIGQAFVLRRYLTAAAVVGGVISLGLGDVSAADAPKKSAQHFSLAGKRPTFHEDNIDKIEVVVAGADSDGRLSLVESIWTTKFSVPSHYHKLHAETFYIISGKVEWTIGGKTQVVGAGDAVHIPSNTVHSVRVLETMHSLMFYQPGAYEDQVALETFYTAEQKKDPKVREHINRMTDFWPVTGTVAPLAAPVANQANKGVPVFSVRGKRPSFNEDKVANVEVVVGGDDTEGRLSVIESDWLPGFTAPLHFHKQHTETFYVFSGKVEWTVNGETHVLGAGDAIHIPANTTHSVKVLEKIHTLWISDPGGLEGTLQSAQKYTAEEMKDPRVMELVRRGGDFHVPGAK